MTFKITNDIIETALTKTVKERANDTSHISKKPGDLNSNPIIKNSNKSKKIVPENSRTLLDSQEIRTRTQDAEARPEDFVELRKPNVRKQSTSVEVLTAGKNYFSLDSQLFGPNANEFSHNDIEGNKKYIDDALRGRTGRYWAMNSKNNGFEFVYDQVVNSICELNIHEPHNYTGATDFGRTSQWVALKGNRDKFKNARGEYSPDFWYSYVQGGIYAGSSAKSKGKNLEFSPTVATDVFYFDHVHELPIPFTSDEIKDFQIPHGVLVGETKHEYNFYIKDYEQTITRNKAVQENTLPNMYVFMSELKNDEPNPEFHNFITLDDTLETNEQLIRYQAGRKKFNIKEHPIGQYYDLFGRQYEKAVSSGAVERLSKKFSNIVVPIEEIELFKGFNDKSEMFPMLVDIRIGTDRTTTFAEILKDSQLTNAFMTRLVNRHIEDNAAVMNSEVLTESMIQRNNGENARKVSSLDTQIKRTWDIAELMEELRQGDEDLTSDSAIFLGNHQQEVNVSSGPEFKFFKSLMFSIFQGKFQSLIKQKFRTLEELMSGKKAYSETVLYRIAKYEFGSDGRAIQNFWLPNSNEIDVLRFLDTQVKYNKRYVYKVFAYQMVIGTKYWYSDLDADSYDHSATFLTHMEPSVKLVETPYMETTLRVTDKPPIPPDVDIVPFKGVDNEMLFFMKGNVGEFDAEPITIQPTDQAIFNTIRESQKKRNNEKISFGADDHPSLFQIFRINKKPESYQDFTGNLQASVGTDVALKTLQGATSAAFVDNLEPNRKYYYIFRTIDIHGHMSNPTPVYEIEIINENGLIFPIIKSVNFKEMNKTSDKPARRFIQIVPNILQSLINEEKSGYSSAETAEEVKRKIHLGVTTDSVWDKRFKIRLTSKSTGKKIELNFGFEHKDDEKA